MDERLQDIGKLPPRYSLLINPYIQVRLSKCPKCRHLTHNRKFALFIHVFDFGGMTLGKTCRYCTSCELIIVHKHELEAQLVGSPAQMDPRRSEEGYFVIGTVDRNVWKKGLTGNGPLLREVLDHMACFKEYLNLHVEPGGWKLPQDK
jgi:hypothetical protein